MTATYMLKASVEEKTLEELRLVRCLLERILRTMDESLFVDYQMEKFSPKYINDITKKEYKNIDVSHIYKHKKERFINMQNK